MLESNVNVNDEILDWIYDKIYDMIFVLHWNLRIVLRYITSIQLQGFPLPTSSKSENQTRTTSTEAFQKEGQP